MKKQKNGFTLTEVLAVVVILAILALSVITAINIYQKEAKEKYNENLEKQVSLVAQNYWAENSSKRPIVSNQYKYVTLEELSSLGLLSKNVIDADSNSCMDDSYVIAQKTGSRLSYTVCLKCGGEEVSDFSNCEIKSDKKYLVEYYSYDGKTKYGDATYMYGSDKHLTKISALGATAPSGKQFYGWTTEANSINKEMKNGQNVKRLLSENEDSRVIKLYAIWRSDAVEITYKSGVKEATTTTSNKYYYYNDETGVDIKTQIPSGINYWEIDGWRQDKNANASTIKANETRKFSSSATLYAVYNRNLTVSYNGNGSTSGSTTSTTKQVYMNTNSVTTSNQTVTISNNGFKKTGYTFGNKWAVNSATGASVLPGASYDPSLTYNDKTFGKTMYAVWDINEVMINYNANGGTITKSTTSDSGTVYNWSTNNSGLIYLNGTLLTQKVGHGQALGTTGLNNYNNQKYINITKPGYIAVSGAEWKCTSGCTTNGKTFSHAGAINASEFCDTSNGDCTVTLAVNWQKKTQTINISIEYDDKYPGPHKDYKTSTYQKLSTNSISSLEYGKSTTITASPAYPDDRYTGSINCNDGISATLSEGSGTTERTDTITITNNLDKYDSEVNSSCVITYIPKWHGIEKGTYTKGANFATEKYADTAYDWTVVSDNGDNIGLAYNVAIGNGTYANAGATLQDKFTNAIIVNDRKKGGLIKQGDYYITSNSGSKEGYTSNYNVWLSSTSFYNCMDRQKYKTTSTTFLYGSSHEYGQGSVTTNSVNNGYEKNGTVAKGVIKTSNTNVKVSNGTVKFADNDPNCKASATLYKQSEYMTRMQLGNCSPDSTQVCYRYVSYTYNNGTYTVQEDYGIIDYVEKSYSYICGGPNDGATVVYAYDDSSTFLYANEATGAGWVKEDGWLRKNAVDKCYQKDCSSSGAYFTGRFAGSGVTNCDPDNIEDCTTTTLGDKTRYIRKHKFSNRHNNAYCKKRTICDPTWGDAKDIYYRPYIIVRER